MTDTNRLLDQPITTTDTQRTLAAAFVARHVPDADAPDVLDMLGLGGAAA